MQKLLIIDGHNLLFQMFFGMPSRIINKNGKAIQGTMGFIGALLKIIRMTMPTHIVAVFDGEAGSDRNEINADYKGNRIDYADVPEENNPFSQLPDIYTALDGMSIRHFETVGVEADDVMASYALKLGKAWEIVIVSFDSDMFQLVGDNVTVLHYRGIHTTVYDSRKVIEKYGVQPCFFADYKALVGDPSDNIRGVDKVGPKTAKSLINKFGDVFAIIGNGDRIEKPSIRQAILDHSERLTRNYQLIKLNDKAVLPLGMDELENSCCIGMTTTEVLRRIGLV